MFQELLCGDLRKLQQALQDDPNLINMKDEHGNTLLHYAAKLGMKFDEERTIAILNTLFSCPLIDLNVTDARGNTPLHIVTMLCNNIRTYLTIFPMFIKKACESNFDFLSFSTIGGFTILHIAAGVSYVGPGTEESVLAHLFEHLTPQKLEFIKKNIDCYSNMDCYSIKKITPLYRAIDTDNFPAARYLLSLGADPQAGTTLKLTAYDLTVTSLRNTYWLPEEETEGSTLEKRAALENLLEEINKILEIKKNARSLAPLVRDGRLHVDMAIYIAALTGGGPGLIGPKLATKIATDVLETRLQALAALEALSRHKGVAKAPSTGGDKGPDEPEEDYPTKITLV